MASAIFDIQSVMEANAADLVQVDNMDVPSEPRTSTPPPTFQPTTPTATPKAKTEIAFTATEPIDNNKPSPQSKEEFELRYEWLGTSQFDIKSNITNQKNGQLPILISQRAYMTQEVQTHPYDLILLLTHAYIDLKLGFHDIAASNAYRALVAIETTLKAPQDQQTIPKNLKHQVLKSISLRVGSASPYTLHDELLLLKKQAYVTLLKGLLGCTAFWDGLGIAKQALKCFPRDVDLLEVQAALKDGFTAMNKEFPTQGYSLDDRLAFTRSGKIYQKVYPWMDEELFVRAPALVREVNAGLREGGNFEIRRAVFGDVDPENEVVREVGEGEDVGPLGVFATRDIKKGELILVDRSMLVVSDIPSSRFLHCNACHASLSVPYLHPDAIIKPSCCDRVAFCSQICHDIAREGYHTVLCGKDIDWLYEADSTGKYDEWSRWKPLLVLRVLAIIISDMRKKDNTIKHPLLHPLLSRLTASYPPPKTTYPKTLHNWHFKENIEAPTRFLTQLGINIYTSKHFRPEVIQTIFWRIENNANQSSAKLLPSSPAVNMINLNLTYLFFNHSCVPNTNWHGTVSSLRSDVELLRTMDGELLKPGEAAVTVKAGRDVKEGEELLITYVDCPLGVEGGEFRDSRRAKRLGLRKWFGEGEGCGCKVCVVEDVVAKAARGERIVRERLARERLAREEGVEVEVVGEEELIDLDID